MVVLLTTASCDSFLEEKNYSSVTDETFLTNESAFEELVVSAYSSMRNVARFNTIHMMGTDIFTRNAKIEGDLPLNDYTNLTSTDGTVDATWSTMYTNIAECNSIISRAETIDGLSESTKSLRVAEVKTIRAWYYFFLVQQFGGVPLVENEISTISTDFTRNTEEEVYAFLISELEGSIAALPLTSDEFGRVTKGVAKHLLAQVYLTRAYTSFAASTDFSKAASLAEEVINSGVYRLLDNFSDVMDYSNQVNDEVIFSIQFTTDYQYNTIVNDGGDGNNRHQLCKFGYDAYPGLTRTSSYGKPLNTLMPTDFFYHLYADADAREDATIRRALLANAADSYNGWDIAVGDTVIYFPKNDWTSTQKASVNYWVFNLSDRFETSEITSTQFPFFRKFDDPNAPFSDAGEGTRDAFIFRLSETYLIAAEAYLNDGNPTKAAEMLNVVRTRAAKDGQEATMQIAVADVNIDLILDEYARELAGETFRWFELKRTGKLSERVVANNPHVALHNTSIDSHYLLRPIPNSEILLTNGSLEQNPGYN